MQLRTHNRKRIRGAFTLMEVLVVVAILVVLAGIGIGVFFYLDQSKENIARIQMRNIETVLENYKLQHGDFPASLEVLTQPEGDKPAPLTDQQILDPWNRPYVLDANTRHPKTHKPLIYSLGVNPGNPAGRIQNWR
jgi:general secretion pathway protein G